MGFVIATMILLVVTMFGYYVLALDLECSTFLLEQTFIFIYKIIELQDTTYVEVPIRYCKDYFFSWNIFWRLLYHYQEIITSLRSMDVQIDFSLCIFTNLIQWYLSNDGIIFIELILGISTNLVTSLKVNLNIRWYINIDNKFISK